jgi:hypothetical protein
MSAALDYRSVTNALIGYLNTTRRERILRSNFVKTGLSPAAGYFGTRSSRSVTNAVLLTWSFLFPNSRYGSDYARHYYLDQCKSPFP